MDPKKDSAVEASEPLKGLLRDFRRIYGRAAGDGREARLFGMGTKAKAEAMLKKYAIDACRQSFYFEVPFTGEPRMDLLLQYNPAAIKLPIAPGASSETKRIFSTFFAECAKDPAIANYLVGFSFDLSEDRDLPGLYLLPPRDLPNVDYVPAMLDRLGEAERLPRIRKAFADAPPAWQPYYIGLMAGRSGAPTRLGFQLDQATWRAYRDDKSLLQRDLSRYYRRPMPKDMLDQIFLLTQKGYVWDLQFDLFPDGDLARALGVSVKDEVEESPQTVAEFTRRNMPEGFMSLLESWNLADERRHLFPDACAAVKRNIIENGRASTITDLVSVSTCKVRFKNEEAYLAKGYIFTKTLYS